MVIDFKKCNIYKRNSLAKLFARPGNGPQVQTLRPLFLRLCFFTTVVVNNSGNVMVVFILFYLSLTVKSRRAACYKNDAHVLTSADRLLDLGLDVMF